MVPKDDPFVGRKKVTAIVETFRWSGAQRIEGQHFGGNKTAVKAIADGVAGNGGDDQPQGVDLFAAMQCDSRQCQRSQQADGSPEKNAEDFWHEFRGPKRLWVANYCGENERRSQAACFSAVSFGSSARLESSVIT